MPKIHSTITGSVIAVHAVPGQILAIDDEVAVLESMKMEIPVRAETAGRVVQEGDALVLLA